MLISILAGDPFATDTATSWPDVAMVALFVLSGLGTLWILFR